MIFLVSYVTFYHLWEIIVTSVRRKQREYKKHDIFLTPVASDISFVDITSQISKDSTSCSQQAARRLEPCGLEIQLPNGIRLKLEKVTFNQVWIQVVEWMRVKHHVI